MEKKTELTARVPWDRKSIQDKIIQVDCKEFLDENTGFSKFFGGMEQNGFVVLTKVRIITFVKKDICIYILFEV